MLSAISIDDAKKWDEIVRSFSNYDIYYLYNYAKASQIHGDGEPVLFYYDDGETRAMNVVLKRDIAKATPFIGKINTNEWFDISTPYGYGGFLVDGHNFTDLNSAYDEYCSENGYICEFVRFQLNSNYQQHYNGTTATYTHHVIRSLEMSLDDIYKEFEHKVRKNLNKATTSGLEIEIDTTGKRIDDFLDIYYSTMKRANATGYYLFSKDFFAEINKMPGQFAYFHVLFNGTVISTELVLNGSENCYSFLGGTNSDFFHLRPNDFLKFEIIKWAKEKALKSFILGGGYGGDDGIFKYKKSLAPNGIYDFYLGKKIFNQEKYNQLIQIRQTETDIDITTSNYFPQYRLPLDK